VKAYKYTLKTSAKFEAARDTAFDVCGELYSAAMHARRDAHQINRLSINCHAQAIQLLRVKQVRVVIKLNPGYTSLHVAALRVAGAPAARAQSAQNTRDARTPV
jgi:hypothetical protein